MSALNIITVEDHDMKTVVMTAPNGDQKEHKLTAEIIEFLRVCNMNGLKQSHQIVEYLEEGNTLTDVWNCTTEIKE